MDKIDIIDVDQDIRRAATLPGRMYSDRAVFERLRERVFAASWQWIGDEALLPEPNEVRPLTLLEGCLDEPLVLVRDADGTLRCLSNVCTHRGNLVVAEAGRRRVLACNYHGRRFGLDGRLQSAPEFEDALDFPRACDDLPELALERLGKLLFTALAPSEPFAVATLDLQRRMAWLPLSEFALDAARSRDYTFEANWALYVDNFLEGFHIPWLHAGLNAAIDYGSYTTELHPRSSVQIALARDGEACFEPPSASPDHGRRIAAYYWWLFPNLMLNFYPWGLSVNLVQPGGVERTTVSFRAYVWRPELLERGAGSALDQVEKEDEAVVESVQRGVRARLYGRGRYSPSREQGVHHFHRMLAAALA